MRTGLLEFETFVVEKKRKAKIKMFTSSQISDFIIYERDEPVVDTICGTVLKPFYLKYFPIPPLFKSS